MKVAIPLFGKRVSPHFCTAQELLVLVADASKICSTVTVRLGELSLAARRAKIAALGVDMLVCGGIVRNTKEWFERRGIKVIADMRGEVEQIVDSLLQQARNHGREPASARGRP